MVASKENNPESTIEQIVERRNSLSLQLRMSNYVGEEAESIKAEIELLDKEIEKRRNTGDWIRDEI